MADKLTTTKKKMLRAEPHASRAEISMVRIRKTALSEMKISNKIKMMVIGTFRFRSFEINDLRSDDILKRVRF